MAKQRKPSKAGVLAMLVIGLAGAGALAVYVRSSGGARAHPEAPAPADLTPQAAPSPSHKVMTAVVLTPVIKDLDVSFTRETKPVPPGEDPMVFAVNQYLGKLHSMPTSARLLGVEVKARLAILSFNQEFVGAGYGSMEEKAVLDGISATLGCDPNVDFLEFQVGGKRIDSLGHADLTDPLPVMRPDGSSPDLPAKPAKP